MNEINRVNNNRINFRGVDKMDKNVEKSEISLSDVKEMIDQMKDEVKSRMYDKNIYPPEDITVGYPDDKTIPRYELRVTPLHQSLKQNEPDFDNLRYLTAVYVDNNMQDPYSDCARGNKSEILDKLNNKNFPKALLARFEDLEIDSHSN